MSSSSTRSVSLAETKNHLADCVRAAESGQSVVITRHGKPVAALVSTEDLALVSRLRAAKQGQGLAALAGGWAGSAELVEHALARRRTSRRRPRA